ncbi:hypothetical protein SPBRAN_1150 [uncultured Candidatus Thioglobus sp.]|nr:hypothetical protein SPBRAN_1150 [uncultured Candidatus Thioglobus sp.]
MVMISYCHMGLLSMAALMGKCSRIILLVHIAQYFLLATLERFCG